MKYGIASLSLIPRIIMIVRHRSSRQAVRHYNLTLSFDPEALEGRLSKGGSRREAHDRQNTILFLFSAFRIPTSEFLKPETINQRGPVAPIAVYLLAFQLV